jgi:DNA-binding response OmpR family regulator
VDVTSRLAMGAADYIPKPFDLDYLGQAAASGLGRARPLILPLLLTPPGSGGAPH